MYAFEVEGNAPITNSKSGNGRLGTLINMIEMAYDLIDASDIEEACIQLDNAYRRCDGSPKPPDFVNGPDATEVADMISATRTSLGCN
ncbi:hypothetical protein ACFLTP_02980 [Chloroflexota bacterium]